MSRLSSGSSKRARSFDLEEPEDQHEGSDGDLEIDDDDLPLSQTDNPGPCDNDFFSQATTTSTVLSSSTPLSSTSDGVTSNLPRSDSDAGGAGGGKPSGTKKLKRITKHKSLHDRCHGPINLEPLLVRVMDTEEFQRLRDLKQLGGSAFVYPDASHSRFEHSLGVAHLSRLMVTHLQRVEQAQLHSAEMGLERGEERFDPAEAIDQRDVTCVSLAGLVHDLGHGPFSHMFEVFVNRVRRQRGEPAFEHEDMSAAILKHLLTRNGILLEEYMGTTPQQAAQDLAFVLALIHGLKPGAPMPPEVGRPPRKRFLFEIVSNHRNGIDVDKLDYFLRDSSSAFGESSPLIHVGRIIDSSSMRTTPCGETTVCYEEKMAMDLLGLFRTRMQLHSHLYQHHVVNVVEEMITDAFTAAQGIPICRGSSRSKAAATTAAAAGGGGGAAAEGATAEERGAGDDDDGKCSYDLLEACNDVEAYVSLGDWVLKSIEASPNPQFDRARKIVRRLKERRLYDQVGVPLTRRSPDLNAAQVLSMIVDTSRQLHSQDQASAAAAQQTSGPSSSSSTSCPVTEAGVLVKDVKINYGKDPVTGKCGYPLKNVFFFNPKQPELKCYHIPESKIGELNLPRVWEECKFWVYVRDRKLKPLVERAWLEVREMLNSQGRAMEALAMQNSPAKDPNSPSAWPQRSAGRRRTSSSSSASRRRSLNSSMPPSLMSAEEPTTIGGGERRNSVATALPMDSISEGLSQKSE